MENWLLAYTVDLAKGDQAVSVLAPNVLALPGDNLAHTWMVILTRNGVPADLTGATATAYFTRGDGNTVMLVGTAEGNVCAYTMLSTCYAVPGPLRCVLKVTSPTIGTVTLLDKIVQVRQGVGGPIIDPGTAIPSLEQLLAAVPAAEAATLAAQIAANMGAGLNLIDNAGVYAGVSGWSLGTNVTRDTTKKLFGAYAVKNEQSGLASDGFRAWQLPAANFIPCAVGDILTVSCWVYIDDYTTFDSTLFIQLSVNDASNNLVQNVQAVITPTSAHNGRWTRLSGSLTITNANAVKCGFYSCVRRNGRAWFACPKIERGGVATDWRPSWADILALPYVEDWKQPTLLNSWTEVSGFPVRYCKDAQGWVHFKGRLSSAAALIPIMVMPAGYRPAVSTHIPCSRLDTDATVARMFVTADGTTYCQPALTAGTAIDISAISYKAEG